MRRLLTAGLLGLLACGPSDEDVAKLLSSNNPAVREDSAKIARNFDADAVGKALVGALADPSPAVRRNAVDSIAELEFKEAVPALLELVQKQDEDPEVLRQTVDALGRLGDPAAVPVLVALLEQQEANPPLNLIWALGNLEDPAALDVLSRLRGSADPYVSFNANAALRKLRP